MVKIIASYVHFKGALAENYLFCNRYHPKMAIKTSLKNVGDNMDGDTHVWRYTCVEHSVICDFSIERICGT